MRGIGKGPRLAAAVLLGLSASAGMGGCALLPDFSGSVKIQAEQVRSAAVCNTEGPQPRVTLLADGLAVRAWQEAHHADLGPGDPLPEAGAYVVAEMGAQGSAGYAIVVSRQAWLSRDAVTLSATLLSPAPDAAAAGSSSPCVLVALPAGTAYRSVELRDAAGALLARSAPQ